MIFLEWVVEVEIIKQELFPTKGNCVLLSFLGELGPADEYSARVDIEVDSPGPSCVIRSIPLRARSGTARVHAPKDLQVTKLLCGCS